MQPERCRLKHPVYQSRKSFAKRPFLTDSSTSFGLIANHWVNPPHLANCTAVPHVHTVQPHLRHTLVDALYQRPGPGRWCQTGLILLHSDDSRHPYKSINAVLVFLSILPTASLFHADFIPFHLAHCPRPCPPCLAPRTSRVGEAEPSVSLTRYRHLDSLATVDCETQPTALPHYVPRATLISLSLQFLATTITWKGRGGILTTRCSCPLAPADGESNSKSRVAGSSVSFQC